MKKDGKNNKNMMMRKVIYYETDTVTEPPKILGSPTYVLAPKTLDSHASAPNGPIGPVSCIFFTSPKSVHPIS
jgi:hypothetical protein